MSTYEQEKKDFAQLKEDIVQLEQMDEDAKQKLSDRLYKMIEYSIGRHDWYDEQRNKLLQLGIAILGAAAVISAVVLSLGEKFSLFSGILLWLFVLGLFSTGLLLIINYSSTIGQNHPYRELVDIRSWYFKYSFPSGLKESLSSKKETAKIEIKEVVDAFKNYLTRWVEYATKKDEFIKEDLEQVFILQLLQRYRFQQLKRMSNILKWGLIASCSFLIISLFGTRNFNSPSEDLSAYPDTIIVKEIIHPIKSDGITIDNLNDLQSTGNDTIVIKEVVKSLKVRDIAVKNIDTINVKINNNVPNE